MLSQMGKYLYRTLLSCSVCILIVTRKRMVHCWAVIFPHWRQTEIRLVFSIRHNRLPELQEQVPSTICFQLLEDAAGLNAEGSLYFLWCKHGFIRWKCPSFSLFSPSNFSSFLNPNYPRKGSALVFGFQFFPWKWKAMKEIFTQRRLMYVFTLLFYPAIHNKGGHKQGFEFHWNVHSVNERYKVCNTLLVVWMSFGEERMNSCSPSNYSYLFCNEHLPTF